MAIFIFVYLLVWMEDLHGFGWFFKLCLEIEDYLYRIYTILYIFYIINLAPKT